MKEKLLITSYKNITPNQEILSLMEIFLTYFLFLFFLPLVLIFIFIDDLEKVFVIFKNNSLIFTQTLIKIDLFNQLLHYIILDLLEVCIQLFNIIISMQFDLFQASSTLRYKGEPKSKSLFLGIVSLLILAFFAYLLFSRLIGTITMDLDQINISTYKEINYTAPNVNAFIFAIRPSYLFQQFSDYGKYFQFYLQFWNQEKQNIENYSLELCRKEQWSRFEQNNGKIFEEARLNQSFCPKTSLNLSAQNFNKNLFKIYLRNCQGSIFCQDMEQYLNQKKYNAFFVLEIKYLSKQVILSQTNQISQFLKTDTFLFSVSDQNGRFYFPYKKNIYQALNQIRIQNDPSLLSFFNLFDHSLEEKIYEYSIGNYYISLDQRNISHIFQDYIQINFFFNEQTLVFTRQRSKIDQIISDVGGIFEIFMIFLLFFFDGYNQIKYELTVAGSYFNYNNDGKKFQRKDLNLWTYFKHSFFYWFHLLFCFQIKQEQMIIMNETLKEAREILDIKNLFRRLQYLEIIVQSICDKNLANTLAICRKNSILEFQNQRVLLSYYENVIKLNEAATVEDAIEKRRQSFAYLWRKSIMDDIKSFVNPENQTSISSPENTPESIKISLMEDLGLDEQISKQISNYPIIAQNAKLTELDIQDEEMEFQITKSFLKLPSKERNDIIMKIPIIILHRIRFVARYMNRRTSLQLNSFQNTNISQNNQKFIIKYQKPLKKRIKKSVLNFFSSWDLFEADPLLRSQSKSQKSNACFGFINLFFIFIVIYLFIDEVQKLIDFDSKLEISQHFEFESGQREIKNFMMAVKLPKIKKGYFSNQLLLFQDFYFQFWTRNKYGQFEFVQMSLVPCQPQNWKLLGDNFYNNYISEGLNETYCLEHPINITVAQKQTKFLYFDFCVKCFFFKNQSCSDQFKDYYNSTLEEYKNFPFWLYYLVPEVQLYDPNPIVYHIAKSRFAILPEKAGVFRQTFSGYKVITDRNLWDFLPDDPQEVKHYRPSSITNSEYLRKDFILNEVIFGITDDILVYSRQRKKIFDIIGYLGGLLGFIFIFFSFFFNSFNQISYQLKAAEGSFNYSEGGKKFSEKKFNFFIYLKYKIFNFIRLIYKKSPKWKYMDQLDKTLEQTNELLDVQNIFLRLQFLEKFMKHSTNKNLLTCMTLVEHLSIADIQQTRNIFNYYGKIVQQDDAATVQDAVHKIEKSLMNLKSFNKTHLEKINFLNKTEIEEFLQKQHSKKQEIYLTLTEYLHLSPSVSRTISEYPEIAEEAKEINLDNETNQIENELAFSFLYLQQNKKNEIVMKIPIIIIHRLGMKARKIKKLYHQISQKQKQRTKSLKDTQEKQDLLILSSKGTKRICQIQDQ